MSTTAQTPPSDPAKAPSNKPKYPGITHVAVKVKDAEATEAFVTANGIEITGRRHFRGTKTIFIRDPDRNVIELDAYDDSDQDDLSGYAAHPG